MFETFFLFPAWHYGWTGYPAEPVSSIHRYILVDICSDIWKSNPVSGLTPRSVLCIIFNVYDFFFSLSWLHSLTLLPINSNTVNNNNNNNDQSKNHNNDDDATVKTKIEIKSEEPEEAAAAVYPQERHKLHLYIHYMYIVHTHIRLFAVFAVPISLLCDVWGDYIYTYQ